MYSQRPSLSETNEDLLRQQQEFKRQQADNKIQLAATVVSVNKKDEKLSSTQVCDVQDQIANTFEAVPIHRDLNIFEKKSSTSRLAPLNFNSQYAFPKPKRRDCSVEASSGGSLFSKQFKRLKKTDSYETIPTQSFIVSGDEKDSIHLENVIRLQNMSKEEILDERDKLLATTDPAIIAFLKSKRKKIEENRNPTIMQQNSVAEKLEITEIFSANEILTNPSIDNWLNFKTIENSKLAWMQQLEQPKITKNQTYEARFDFEGWLLPFSDPTITEKSRILYHHGDEPARPGYTLQELFQLARSNIIQQKVIALNSIANILSLQSTGVYDNVIELPIEQIFFVVRFCLDDNIPSVLNASLKAIRNLFYNSVDEICLDSLLGFGLGNVMPILAIDNDGEDDRINDQQLAESNLIKCLIRSDILIRIRYVINTVQPTVETNVYCLEILIRLARDSTFILTKLYNCDDLIQSIIRKFIDKNDLVLLQAIKLVRVMAARSRTIARDFVEKHHILGTVLHYLGNDGYSRNANGLKLQAECLHLWGVFDHYGLTGDYIGRADSIFSALLLYHYQNTDLNATTTYLRQGHLAALLLLLFNNKSPLLENCIKKWCHQFQQQTHLTCGKLQIISTIFNLTYFQNFCPLVGDILNSETFEIITKSICTSSMLLNNYENHRSSANLKTVEAPMWHTSEHIVPILQTNSPLPFLAAVSQFIEKSTNKNVKLRFMQCGNIVNYIEALRKLPKFYLCSNWFTRIESFFIMNLLKISVAVQDCIETNVFFELAVKSLNIFGDDQKLNVKYILENIVFSASFYPSDCLMRHLNLNDHMEASTTHLTDVLQVYSQVLALENATSFSTNLSFDSNRVNSIPIDWIYTPIMVLYSKENNSQESDKIFIIQNCLRWILIYETYFPELSNLINPTDRYCRLACVFLSSDNLFLHKEINKLLELCLKNVLRNSLNFEDNLEGLSSFQDLYKQLLEQYQGVSYGDVTFSNFILVPLAQRYSIKWKKILWSEYFGVVEILNVTEEQCVSPIESFVEPFESDLSLLKCYKRGVCNNSVKKTSVLYKIAKCHVENYLRTINKS